MKTTFLKIVTVLMAVLIISCSPEDGIDGVDGINGNNGKDGVVVYYNPITLSGKLNGGSVTVDNLETPLNIGTRTFTKISSNTHVDIKLRSNIRSGTFSDGARAIKYELRVDDVKMGEASSKYSCFKSNSTEFVTLDATFSRLPAGSHAVTIVAYTTGGLSTGVVVDPGGYGGSIIVQER